MDHLENLNLFSAYSEIKAIERKIELLLTLRATADGIKPNRLKIVFPQTAIVFMREYEKKKWNDIAKEMNYSEKQVRRYYNKYKEDSLWKK